MALNHKRTVNLVAILKKGGKSDLGNPTPVTLTSQASFTTKFKGREINIEVNGKCDEREVTKSKRYQINPRSFIIMENY